MNALNAAQAAAVASDASQILCIASPGAGKTAVLIERIVRLIESGVPAEQIVALTFTRNAAAEIQERVDEVFHARGLHPLPGFKKTDIVCNTLHGFLLKLIQENFALLGYPSARLAVLDEEAAGDLLMRCAGDLGCKTSRRKLKAQMGGEGELALDELVIKRFTKTMRANGVITYDAILTEGLRLLPQIDLPYTHLLIDEVQDSSDIDARIYEALPIENKFFVGDPDQNIYSWRGANLRHILDLWIDLETGGDDCRVFRLEENYRSDRLICEAAQKLIEHNTNRVQKTIRPVSGEDGDVKVIQFTSASTEMIWTGVSIKGELERGQSVAVLLRTNKLVDQWREFLTGQGIPVASRQHTERPQDWPVVKAALAVLNDPANDWNCYNLIRLKDGELKANEVQTLAAAAGVSINEWLFHLPELTPNEWRAILARLGASSESLRIVDEALAKSPEASGTELMALLAEDENHEDTIGHGVFVSTIHGAKGKEFSTVFLPAFEDEIIPGKSDEEENRRLAYVAVTRAKHRLFISYCSQRKPAYGGWKPVPATPSRFIREMGLLS